MADSDPDPRLAVSLGTLTLRMLRAGLHARDVTTLVVRPDLAQAFLQLSRLRRSASPYRVETGFAATLRRRRAGVARRELVYGETPVWTARRLLAWAELGPAGRLLDVGAGRGQVLLAARWLGAEARGVEIEARHVEVARRVVEACGASLEVGDGAEADLGAVTHVFCAWTTWSPEARARLSRHLRGLAAGARVLTLGGPIEEEGFTEVGERTVLVPWGLEQACLQRRGVRS